MNSEIEDLYYFPVSESAESCYTASKLTALTFLLRIAAFILGLTLVAKILLSIVCAFVPPAVHYPGNAARLNIGAAYEEHLYRDCLPIGALCYGLRLTDIPIGAFERYFKPYAGPANLPPSIPQPDLANR